MATTFISKNQKGFWVRDGILEIWLRLAALHLREPGKDDKDAKLLYEIRNNWLFASRGKLPGGVPFDLEKQTNTEQGKAIVLKALMDLGAALRRAPEELDKDTINILGFEGGRVVGDIETWRLMEINESMISLVNGKQYADAADKSFMPGCALERKVVK